ncbi:hypothetical protein Q765_07635 [Flavobacterium rivuli WB 3.3-2 = DSM 21788]|uniref:Uncharacterized protein n=1 Tax=Flavobacterium rivuli WB 3.3-2 = DSM 21788 TaxID=1121895 RepID=A0A0A2M350_9FLAO|nr:hypothetical protein [Flavobacterium rivuli]KGO87072.1 hypothetical protein Q765_07635 [Flavobacterium rivuli WB 3.3-2 = DSM 21788]
MLTDVMLKNSVGLMRLYLSNLFEYITESDFQQFIQKAYSFTVQNEGVSLGRNFVSTFFELLREHRENNESIIRNEFSYFNFLLGGFLQYGNHKEFRCLLIATLLNFKSNNFHHVLGEIAACRDLCESFIFHKYENILPNCKSLDFRFSDLAGNIFFVDVVTIEYDISKYEKENFEKFIKGRLAQKFNSKTVNLEEKDKKNIFIYPILFGFSTDIIIEHSEFLKSLQYLRYPEYNFQCFSPKAFGNIQGTFFNMFSIDEIVNPVRYFRN